MAKSKLGGVYDAAAQRLFIYKESREDKQVLSANLQPQLFLIMQILTERIAMLRAYIQIYSYGVPKAQLTPIELWSCKKGNNRWLQKLEV